jgi:hypothetical protein
MMIRRKASLRTGWLGMLLLPFLLSGCFLTDALPQDKKSTSSPGTTTEEPPKTPPVPTPVAAAPYRLARRLSIDLAMKLPSLSDITALENDPKVFDQLVDSYLTGAAADRAIAARHLRMWHLTSETLPDLDRFVEEGDTTLAAALTDTVRRQLVEMPLLPLRLGFEQGVPFNEIFTRDFTIAPEELLANFDLTDDGEAWVGEPYRFGLYADGRPATGPLASPGFLAAFAGLRDATPRARTNRILKEVTCLKNESPTAHVFADLTGAELVTDLAELATQRAGCVGCHSQIEGAAKAFAGLGSGAAFSTWKSYDAPAATPEGNYAGQDYQGLDGLAAAIGSDSRTHRCEVEKLMMNVMQRPLGVYDNAQVSIALDEFYRSDLKLMAAARRIFQSAEYSYDTISSDVTGDYLRSASGVRILGRVQWRGLLDDLIPGNTLVVPEELDPGYDETVSSDDHVPTGRYLHAVERLARQAATALVDAELQPGMLAQSRRLFTGLADGTGESVSTATVFAVMRDVWRRLTGETLEQNDPRFLDLQTLWSATKIGGSADEFKRGWRTVLVAMFTHPSFIGY